MARVGSAQVARHRAPLKNDDADRPPICPRCGVTMVPAALSGEDDVEGEWVCLECEELGEDR